MAKYEVTRKDNGESIYSGRATDWAGCSDFLKLIGGQGDSDKADYFFGGNQCSWTDLMNHTKDAEEAYFSKKEQTHKRVIYYAGVCGGLASNNKHTAWVKK